MAKYNLRWTDDELTVMGKCVADGCTLKETLERFEGTTRTKSAISSKRRQLIKAGVSDSMREYTKPKLDDLGKEEVVEYVKLPDKIKKHANRVTVLEHEARIRRFIVASIAAVIGLYLLTEGNYIDWS